MAPSYINVTNLLVSSLSFFLNVILLCLIAFKKQKLNDATPKVFLINLLVSHITATIACVYVESELLLTGNAIWEVSTQSQIFRSSLLMFTYYTFILITSDRFVLIRFPLNYHTVASKNKITVLSVLGYISVALMVAFSELLHVLDKPTAIFDAIILVSAMVLTCILVLTVNIYIYRIIRKHRLRVVPSTVGAYVRKTYFTVNNKNESIMEQENKDTDETAIKTDARQNGSNELTKTYEQPFQRKRTRNNQIGLPAFSMLLSTLFMLCTIPNIASVIYTVFEHNPNVYIRLVANLCLNLNFIIIPVSISIRNKWITKEVRRLFKCCD